MRGFDARRHDVGRHTDRACVRTNDGHVGMIEMRRERLPTLDAVPMRGLAFTQIVNNWR